MLIWLGHTSNDSGVLKHNKTSKLYRNFSFLSNHFKSLKDNYTDGIINTTLELWYTMSVIYTSENVEVVITNVIEKLPINSDEIETIR